MPTKIKLKCPKCNHEFLLSFIPEMETKWFTCPNSNCGQKHSFREYAIVDDGLCHKVMGHLLYEGKKIFLHEGVNTIGRQCSDHLSEIELDNISNRASRKHLVIDVSRIDLRGYVYKTKLAVSDKGHNPTFVNAMELKESDSIILNDGDVIKLPDGSKENKTLKELTFHL